MENLWNTRHFCKKFVNIYYLLILKNIDALVANIRNTIKEYVLSIITVVFKNHLST
jgi:hypothetical protein